MSGITAVDRQIAWNIIIRDCPPTNDCVAGAFQFWHQPFLRWRDLFDDLILCFDLDKYLRSSDGVLVLWIRDIDKVVHGITNSYVSYTTESNPEESDVFSQFITVGNVTHESNEDPLETKLHLSLVFHDIRNCDCEQSSLDNHLRSGCATPVQLIMNPHNQYLPIPSSFGSHSIGPSASPSTRNSPAKRSRTEALQESSCETLSRSKYTVPTELELNVKGLYNGKCVITGHSFSWGNRMVAGPGIETCHIIPKSMYYWHPNQQLSQEEMWNQVNSTVNCMTMDSVCHAIHDNRLLAVHHDTHRVRLFAPMPDLIMRNNQKALFLQGSPGYQYLAWHYKLTVMENMCAIFLDMKGGAKRMPWRKTPVPLGLNNEENNSPVGSKFCGSLIPDRICRGTGLSHASSEEAPKEQSENFRTLSGLNSTNSSNMENMERDRIIPLSSGGSANLSAIRAPFTIRCNYCDAAIPNTHWHCSIRDDADFDLCANFVEKGALCNAPAHWSIKQFLDGGKVTKSTTETIAPKDTKSEPKTSPANEDTNIESEKEIPGAFTSGNKATVEICSDVSRRFNSCVQTFDDANSVTCTSCGDYDLCMPRQVRLKHSHQLSPHFEPASNDSRTEDEFAMALYDMLEAEAWHQGQREKEEASRREQEQKFEAWSLSRRRLHSLRTN